MDHYSSINYILVLLKNKLIFLKIEKLANFTQLFSNIAIQNQKINTDFNSF